MRRMSAAAAIVLLYGAGLGAGQQQGPPKPTAEHQKLGYFVGNWTTTAEMKPSPFGPGGKMTATDACEWFDGGFAVVCRSKGTSPMGPTSGLGIMGYNAEEKVYTYYGVDNSPMNMGSVPKGTVQGNTWTFSDESLMGGKKIKSRFIITTSSPTSYTFKWELEQEPGKWAPIVEGTTTKKGKT